MASKTNEEQPQKFIEKPKGRLSWKVNLTDLEGNPINTETDSPSVCTVQRHAFYMAHTNLEPLFPNSLSMNLAVFFGC